MPSRRSRTDDPCSDDIAVAGDEPPPRLRLGGMALRNGLLIHGPTSWAAAVRGGDAEIKVASGRKPVIAPAVASRVPILRGPLKLAEAFAVIPLVRARLPQARLPFEDPRVIAAMVVTGVASGLVRRLGLRALFREGAVSALGLAPALVALRDSELAAYHGAEHKAIGAYERGEDDPAAAPKEHERCGTNLVVPMFVLSIAGQALLERVIEKPGPLAKGAVAFGSISLAAELFAWSERHPRTSLARAVRGPAHGFQRLIATREPTSEQLEVGTAALAEILRAEQVLA